MQIHLNTDSHVQGGEALAAWVRKELGAKLSRFGDQITRVEVHLSDTSAARGGDSDKRCLLEVRPAGRAALAVTHDAGKVGDAVHGAADKLVRALDAAVGRSRDAHGRETIRGE